jgi:hypothetical protein
MAGRIIAFEEHAQNGARRRPVPDRFCLVCAAPFAL